MNRPRLVLLALCFMAFGLMAINVTAGQAETGARWLVLKTNGTLMSEAEIKEGKVSFALEAETPTDLDALIAGLAFQLLCASLNILSADQGPNGTVTAGVRFRYFDCSIFFNGVYSAPCKPKAGGTSSGVVTSQAVHGLLVLHELVGGAKDDVLRFLPDTGETFAFIETSEECPIGEKIPLIGKMTLKDCESLALTHLVKHLVEAGPLTELWVVSKTAEHVVTLKGSEWLSLGGAGSGLKWSGDPA